MELETVIIPIDSQDMDDWFYVTRYLQSTLSYLKNKEGEALKAKVSQQLNRMLKESNTDEPNTKMLVEAVDLVNQFYQLIWEQKDPTNVSMKNKKLVITNYLDTLVNNVKAL